MYNIHTQVPDLQSFSGGSKMCRIVQGHQPSSDTLFIDMKSTNLVHNILVANNEFLSRPLFRPISEVTSRSRSIVH